MTTLAKFRENVDLYSADLSRWPQEEVKPALALIEQEAEARAYFDAALALDATLRAYAPKPAALEALEARIMKEIAGAPRERPAAPVTRVSAALPFGRAWLYAPGGGLVAAAVIGFLIGFTPAQQAETLLDPVYYSQDQIVDDVDTLEGGIL